ncbi:MAG TPA: TonB-dependent receptor, partial [Allosphingosinicella sp.]
MKRFLAALLLGVSPAALLAQATPAPQPAPSQPPRAAPAPQAPPRQAPPPAAEDEEDENAITVTGSRRALPGSVIVDIAPEVTLGPTDVRSYGVNSVSQLLAELAPQTGSGRGAGAPVVLLNGRRISSLREIADVPTEAIQRVEILPEEVALSYGYPADQKVVNIVLRRRFRSITAEGAAGVSTAGGGESGSADLNLLRIRGPSRLNFDVRYQRSASLLESQRDIIPSQPRLPFDFIGNVTGAGGPGTEIDPALSALAGEIVTVAGVPPFAGAAPVLADFAGTANIANVSDISRYRTLRPATDQLAINAVYARPVFGNFTATLNASLQANGSEALSGPAGVSLLLPAANPFSPFGTEVALNRYVAEQGLSQRAAGETGHAGVTLNGDHAGWHWNLTANYDRVESRTTTERGVDPFPVQLRIGAGDPSLDPFGPIPAYLYGPLLVDRARSLSNSGNFQAIANGNLFDLPGGALAATFKLGAAALGFDTETIRAGLTSSAELAREDVNGQVTLNLPITSRRRHFGAAIGDLSANFNFTARELSDFGTITTLGYGLTWRPRDGITLLWSMSDDYNAPSVQQLGNPQILTPGVPVFDYVTGETVLVTRRDGGNPDLAGDRRRVFSIGLNATLLREPQLNFTANYVRTRTDDAIASLPAATADIEAAFPDRFLRDADGDLVALDNRPVNFARENREQLRWGVNLSVPLRASAAQRARLLAAFQAAGGVEALRRQFGDRGGRGGVGRGEGRRRGDGSRGAGGQGGAEAPPSG